MCSGWSTQCNVGECDYKFAVVNNMMVDKPHHVTLQKQKGEMGEGMLGCVCVCVVKQRCKMNAAQNEFKCMKRKQTFHLKRSSEQLWFSG